MEEDTETFSELVPSDGGGRLGLRDRDLLRAVAAISKALNLDQPLSATLELIAEKVSQTLGHKGCAILLLDEETGGFSMEAAYGLPEGYLKESNAILNRMIEKDGFEARSVTLQAMRTRLPVHVPDIAKEPRFEPWRDMGLEAGFGSIVSLPLVFREEPIGVLNCYDEAQKYSESRAESLTVVAAQAASAVGMARLVLKQRNSIARLNELNQRIVAQGALMRRSEEVRNALTTLLFEDRSLDEITAALSGMLGLPVVLQDERFRELSRADQDRTGYAELPPDGQESPRLTPRKSKRAEHVKLRADNGLGAQVSPEAMLVRVAVGEHEYGYLSVPARPDLEDEGFLRGALEHAAMVYALHMIRQSATQEAERRVRGDLLVDLVEERFRSEEEVRNRARQMGLDLSRTFRIFIVKPESLVGYLQRKGQRAKEVGRVRGKLVALARGFSAHFGSGEAVAVGDHVVTFVPSVEGDEPRQAATRLLAATLRQNPDLSVRVGISEPCSRPRDFAGRYRETLTLLDVAERLGAPSQTVTYEDWGMYGLLAQAGRSADVRELAHRILDPLVTQDQNGRGYMLTTLVAYLDNGLSPTRTARALYLHLNTIKYRLNRTFELLKLDAEDLDRLLSIKMALMVRNLDPEAFDREAHRNRATPEE